MGACNSAECLPELGTISRGISPRRQRCRRDESPIPIGGAGRELLGYAAGPERGGAGLFCGLP